MKSREIAAMYTCHVRIEVAYPQVNLSAAPSPSKRSIRTTSLNIAELLELLTTPRNIQRHPPILSTLPGRSA